MPTFSPLQLKCSFTLLDYQSLMPGECILFFQEDLATKGVMIRHYNKKELRGYVRVSVGKPEHTDILMKCLRGLY